MLPKPLKAVVNRILEKVHDKIERIKVERIKEELEQLKTDANFSIGENCLLEKSFGIYANEFVKGMHNVEIGADCHLAGQIELQVPEAKVKIGNRVLLNKDTRIVCKESITIEDDVLISWGCTIIDTDAHSTNFEDRKNDVIGYMNSYKLKNWDKAKTLPVVIRSKSWIGFNTIIAKGVTIAEGTIVGCGSVVTKSTDPYTVVGGNPAVIIKKLDTRN